MQDSIFSIFSVDSVWSVVFRGILWIAAVIVLAYGADEGHKKAQIKNETGLFFLFLILTGTLIYFIFGVNPTLQ